MTSAVKNLLGGDQAMEKSRKESIMADAAYEILTSNSRKTTGQSFVDDFVLGSVGKQDLSEYKGHPSIKEHELLLDFMA
jgi:citronellol/citronellal dehydrogenase